MRNINSSLKADTAPESVHTVASMTMANKMNPENIAQLAITSEIFAKTFDSQEKAFDRIPSLMEHPVIFPRGFSIPLLFLCNFHVGNIASIQKNQQFEQDSRKHMKKYQK